ncbi:MAG: hypothetical protein OXH00_21750 [Candidatus Poribacteria bacterium]|nr:hypothetical protein [Candidatus Poribacteria bacterium]
MFIKTEDNKIINLNHYRSVEVCKLRDGYVLRALLAVGFENRTKYDDIAAFDDEEAATKALDHLFGLIFNEKTACNLKDFGNGMESIPIVASIVGRKG